RVVEVEGDGALAGPHQDGFYSREVFEGLLEAVGVSEGGAHQEKTSLRQAQEWRLPGYAAIAVGVVVELVHHYPFEIGEAPLAQGHVGQDLCRAADHGCIA